MDLTGGIILMLATMNVVQLLYWSSQTHKLLDKLMSRNYAEYVQTERFKHELPHARAIDPESESFIDEDLKTLNNTMAGLI